MRDIVAPPAASVAETLSLDIRQGPQRTGPESTAALVPKLLRIRNEFGITRVGSTTRLGASPVSVVQAVRPLALSNAVSQGKGLSIHQAAVSAFMESLETWSAERLPAARITIATARDMGAEVRALYAGMVRQGFEAGWDHLPLAWTDGWDLLTNRTIPVPVALVDTVYTLPSAHAPAFPRTTTGLGAGTSLLQALLHAGLEILERDAVATARHRGSFCDRLPAHPDAVSAPISASLLARCRAAGLIAGLWRLESMGGLPVYRCHVMQSKSGQEFAPLPAQGFGCDFTDDLASTKAVLEACQARVTAIAGAREDITRTHYPNAYDRRRLSVWRSKLTPSRPETTPQIDGAAPASGMERFEALLDALRAAGAKAAIATRLYARQDPRIEVMRLVAPPLQVVTAA